MYTWVTNTINLKWYTNYSNFLRHVIPETQNLDKEETDVIAHKTSQSPPTKSSGITDR